MLSGPPSFSIVVIARDEARALPRLLADLAVFRARGGEVIVVDTGSRDDTAAVARAHGCRVAEAPGRFDLVLSEEDARRIDQRFALRDEGPLARPAERIFDFGAARQYGASLASQPWVFHLDACDALEAFDLEHLDEAVRSDAFARIAYDLVLGTSRVRFGRFYDRRRAHWEGRVHELVIFDAGPSPEHGCTDRQLLVRHLKDPAKAREYYLAGLALEIMQGDGSARWLHYLGRELYYRNCHWSALPLLEENAARADAWAPERCESLCLAGACHEALGDMTRAADAYERAHDMGVGRREPLLRLADLRSRRSEFQASADAAERALAMPRTCGFTEPDANYSWLPHAKLYWALFWLGRREEARAHWEICRLLDPDSAVFQAHARLFQ